ncbi:MAG: hypothetical protein ACO1OY_13900 [Ramlibacter sp.]
MERASKRGGWAAALLLLLAAPLAHAQVEQPTYKCLSRTSAGRTSVTYTHVPCTGGRELGAAKQRVAQRYAVPPQDRATLARRAPLSAEDKQECRALDGRLRDQKRQLEVLGDNATLQDEMPLVHSQRRYRELRC